MIKAKYITEIDGKPITEVTIQGDAESVILEFSAIIKGIVKNPVLLGPAIGTLDDMIANIDDDIEQLKKEMKNK